jgi:hypothetical protein
MPILALAFVKLGSELAESSRRLGCCAVDLCDHLAEALFCCSQTQPGSNLVPRKEHLHRIEISPSYKRPDKVDSPQIAAIFQTIVLHLPIDSVMSFLSTTGGVVPVDSGPQRG